MRTVRIFLFLLFLASGLLAAQQSGTTTQGTPDRIYRVGEGVTPPRVIDAPDPKYPTKARKEKIQGTVVLGLIVGPDGLPRDVKVQRSLREDFDEEAIKAVSKWKFHPSTKDGQPVAVQVNVEVNFRMH